MGVLGVVPGRGIAGRQFLAVEADVRSGQSTAVEILPRTVALTDQSIGSLNARREAVARLHRPRRTGDASSVGIEARQAQAHRRDATLAEKENNPTPEPTPKVTRVSIGARANAREPNGPS